jgi:hypothetical protein
LPHGSGYNAGMKYSLQRLMTFSIRDLLWLLALAAVLTAWGIDHWTSSQDEAGLMKLLNEEHQKVNFYKGLRP